MYVGHTTRSFAACRRQLSSANACNPDHGAPHSRSLLAAGCFVRCSTFRPRSTFTRSPSPTATSKPPRIASRSISNSPAMVLVSTYRSRCNTTSSKVRFVHVASYPRRSLHRRFDDADGARKLLAVCRPLLCSCSSCSSRHYHGHIHYHRAQQLLSPHIATQETDLLQPLLPYRALGYAQLHITGQQPRSIPLTLCSLSRPTANKIAHVRELAYKGWDVEAAMIVAHHASKGTCVCARSTPPCLTHADRHLAPAAHLQAEIFQSVGVPALLTLMGTENDDLYHSMTFTLKQLLALDYYQIRLAREGGITFLTRLLDFSFWRSDITYARYVGRLCANALRSSGMSQTSPPPFLFLVPASRVANERTNHRSIQLWHANNSPRAFSMHWRAWLRWLTTNVLATVPTRSHSYRVRSCAFAARMHSHTLPCTRATHSRTASFLPPTRRTLCQTTRSLDRNRRHRQSRARLSQPTCTTSCNEDAAEHRQGMQRYLLLASPLFAHRAVTNAILTCE